MDNRKLTVPTITENTFRRRPKHILRRFPRGTPKSPYAPPLTNPIEAKKLAILNGLAQLANDINSTAKDFENINYGVKRDPTIRNKTAFFFSNTIPSLNEIDAKVSQLQQQLATNPPVDSVAGGAPASPAMPLPMMPPSPGVPSTPSPAVVPTSAGVETTTPAVERVEEPVLINKDEYDMRRMLINSLNVEGINPSTKGLYQGFEIATEPMLFSTQGNNYVLTKEQYFTIREVVLNFLNYINNIPTVAQTINEETARSYLEDFLQYIESNEPFSYNEPSTPPELDISRLPSNENKIVNKSDYDMIRLLIVSLLTPDISFSTAKYFIDFQMLTDPKNFIENGDVYVIPLKDFYQINNYARRFYGYLASTTENQTIVNQARRYLVDFITLLEGAEMGEVGTATRREILRQPIDENELLEEQLRASLL